MRRNRMLKVLLVDDRAMDISSLNFMSELLGLEATLAFDGSDAWKIASEKKFDLIVLDWNMPMMSGGEFLKNLEAELADPSSGFPRTRNIVLHTAERMDIHDFSTNAPFRILDIWQKPIGPADLLLKMKQVRELIGA